jgi:hypothetical protein
MTIRRMLALLCNNALFHRRGKKKSLSIIVVILDYHFDHLRPLNAPTDMSITLHELIRHECPLAFEFKDDINDPLQSWRH